MAVTIDATVGGSSANSFATLAELTTYMEGRLNSDAFDDATTDEQNRALVEATRDVSNKSFVGSRVTTTQALSWPRQWAVDPDSPSGWYYDSSVVPQRVKDATMELAFQFLQAGTTDLASADVNAGVTMKQVDVLVTQWDQYKRPTGMARFPRVLELLRPLLAGSGSSAPVVRG